MSKFEIVAGVEGDCLMMDGTRTSGPKPWGGGPVVKTFTTDGIYEAIDKKELELLMSENAKLRELLDAVLQCAGETKRNKGCDACPMYDGPWRNDGTWCLLRPTLRDLGIEVEA